MSRARLKATKVDWVPSWLLTVPYLPESRKCYWVRYWRVLVIRNYYILWTIIMKGYLGIDMNRSKRAKNARWNR